MTRSPLQTPELVKLMEGAPLTGKTGRNVGAPRGASTRTALVTLGNLFQERKPETTIEIGLAYGASCLLLAACHQNLGRPPAGQHVAIDPFQECDLDNIAIKLLEEAGLERYVSVMQEPSFTALPRLLAEGRRFQLAYVDGSHLFEDVFVDFYFLHHLLEPGGALIFDDCADPHVRKALRFIGASYQEFYREESLLRYREQSVPQRMKYQVGGLIGRTQTRCFVKLKDGVRVWDAPFQNF
jgi:predicted O-methyltransferase YrrM